MIKQKLKFLVLSVLLLALPAVTQAQVLVEDGFAGSAGALPDAAKFDWGGNATLNGAGQLSVETLPSGFSWIRSKAGAAPGLGQTLVLQMRASAYAEGGSPGIVYGDKQPRGLRVGTNINNSVEFYSAARTSVGMRVRKDGVESSATYALPAGVYSMHDYQISVTTTSAVFTVDGALAGTFTTNIPTGVLNIHVCAYYGGGGNVSVTIDSLSLSLTNNQVQGPPAISSFTPTNGPVGSSVAISGTNFTGITAVRFGGVDASFTNNSALLITAIVPPTAATGLISVVSTNGTAASSNNFVVQPLDFTWTTNAGAITITGYTGSGGAVTIPCVINGWPVTDIGQSAFYSRSSLTSIVIPDSVTNIGNTAFANCSSLVGVYFQGNAPSLGGSSVFSGAPTTVYYLPGMTGWPAVPDAWGGRPTALWFLPNPLILNNGPSFGVRTNKFGFIISWATNVSVVVEACTNLANPVWLPLQTNTLTGGSSYFSDPAWTNYTCRFYRLRSPWGGSGQISIISVSSTSPTPLTPLALATTGIASNDPVSVTFFNSAGFSVTNTPIRVEPDGTVIVAVPLYVNPSTSTITNGTVSLVLSQGSQVSTPVTISIQDLPPISTYGTQLGEISHATLVFDSLLLGQRLNQLQAFQVLPGNSIDTSQAQSTLSNLLNAVIQARGDVERVMLDNSVVITNGTLLDGTPIQFDKDSLDFMDRINAVFLTQTLSALGLPSPSQSQRSVLSSKAAAQLQPSEVKTLIQLMKSCTGVEQIITAALDSTIAKDWVDVVQAVAIGGSAVLVQLPQTKPVKALGAGGAILSDVRIVGDVFADDFAYIQGLITRNQALMNAAEGEMRAIDRKKLYSVGIDLVLALFGDVAGLETKSTVAGLIKSYYDLGEAKQANADSVSVDAARQWNFDNLLRVGEMDGTAPAQSSLDLRPFGAGALGIQGIADSSGNYEMFVPLDVPGTDYGTLTLSAGDPISGSIWDSKTVDLRGLDTSKPIQVPPLTQNTCTYTYSDWTPCQPDNTRTRTVISSTPAGCSGTPILSQSCTYTTIPIFRGTAVATATSSAPSSQFYNGGCLPDPVVGTSTFTPRTVELVLDANPLVLGPISGTLYLGSTTQTVTIPEVTCIDWFDGQALTHISPSATYTGDLPAYSRPINGHSDGTNIVLDPDGSYDSETFTGTVSTAPVTGIVQFSGQDIVTFINNRQTNVIITTYSLTRQ